MMMTYTRRTSCLLLSLLVGCAPTTLSTRTDKEFVRADRSIGPGHDRVVNVAQREHDDGATLTLTSRETCEEQRVNVIHRQAVTERKADVGAEVELYLAAAVAGGVGAAFVGVAPDPKAQPARTLGYTLGGVTLGLSAVLLGLGIGTAVRGRDLVTDLGETTENEGPQRTIICNEGPVANTGLAIAVNDAAGTTRIGVTDREGHLEVRWNDFRQLLISGGASTQGTIYVEGGMGTGTLDLTPARRYVAPRVLEEAKVLLAAGKTSDAAQRVKEAEQLGGDVTAAKGHIESARAGEEARAAEVRAEKLLADHDTEGALAAVRTAKSLGADVNALEARVVEARSAEGIRHLAEAKLALKHGKLEEVGIQLEQATSLGNDDPELRHALLEARAQRSWKVIANRNEVEALRDFVSEYGETKFGAIAGERLARLEAQANQEKDKKALAAAKAGDMASGRPCLTMSGRSQEGCFNGARATAADTTRGFLMKACEMVTEITYERCLLWNLVRPRPNATACEAATAYAEALNVLPELADTGRVDELTKQGDVFAFHGKDLRHKMAAVPETKRRTLLEATRSNARKWFAQVGTAGDSYECQLYGDA